MTISRMRKGIRPPERSPNARCDGSEMAKDPALPAYWTGQKWNTKGLPVGFSAVGRRQWSGAAGFESWFGALPLRPLHGSGILAVARPKAPPLRGIREGEE